MGEFLSSVGRKLVTSSILLGFIFAGSSGYSEDFSDTVFRDLSREGYVKYKLSEDSVDRYLEVLRRGDVYDVVEVAEAHRDFPEKIREFQRISQEDLRTNLRKLYNGMDFHRASLAHSERQLASQSIYDSSSSFLWKVEHQWNWEWERKFGEWVSENVDSSFTQRYRIKTDCADLKYAIRWIFARIHKLPAANTLAGSGKLFTQDHVKPEWESLPTAELWYEDQKFRAAIDYLMDTAYTHTLSRDSYPMRIDRETFLPGSHVLEVWPSSGHTYLVGKITFDSASAHPVTVYSSTVPRDYRNLQEGMLNVSQFESFKDGGLLKLRWPVRDGQSWSLVPMSEMPGYSLEQYEPDFVGESGNFSVAVAKRLVPDWDPKGAVISYIDLVKTMIDDRLEIVKSGYEACKVISCEPGTDGWENWSTPSRDGRLLQTYGTLSELLASLAWHPDYWDLFSLLEELKNNHLIVNGESITYGQGIALAQLKIPSHDPRDSIARRWGLDTEQHLEIVNSSLDRIIAERQKLIVSEDNYKSCEENCSMIPTTESLDEALIFTIGHKSEICKLNLERLCEDLSREYKIRQFEVPGLGSYTFSELEFRIPLYNSFPTHSWKRRWGFVEEDYEVKKVEVAGKRVLIDASNAKLSFSGRTGDVLITAEDQTLIAMPFSSIS